MRSGRVRPAIIPILAAVLAGPSSGSADVVAVEGKPMAVGVTVIELRDGSLFYRLPSDREVDRPIEQVKYLQITGWDVFKKRRSCGKPGIGEVPRRV